MVLTLQALAVWAVAFIASLVTFAISGIMIVVQLVSQIVTAVSPMFINLYHSIINLF